MVEGAARRRHQIRLPEVVVSLRVAATLYGKHELRRLSRAASVIIVLAQESIEH